VVKGRLDGAQGFVEDDPLVDAGRPGCDLEHGRDRDEVLLHALVQVSLDPLAVGIVGQHEPPARTLQADDLVTQPIELLKVLDPSGLHRGHHPIAVQSWHPALSPDRTVPPAFTPP
jgi:hypothetical protein